MKTALITGATGSLGEALAEAFYPYCLKMLLCGRSGTALQHLTAKFQQCLAITGDLTARGTIDGIIHRAIEFNIDVLVCSAGMYESDDVQKVIDTNLTANVKLISQLCGQHFFKRKSGTIVVVNSQAGKHGNEKEAVYCASKFGLRGFTESIRQQCMLNGVRLLSIYPGAFRSKITQSRKDFDKLMRPCDIAQTVADLCFKQTALRLDDVDILRTTY